MYSIFIPEGLTLLRGAKMAGTATGRKKGYEQ